MSDDEAAARAEAKRREAEQAALPPAYASTDSYPPPAPTGPHVDGLYPSLNVPPPTYAESATYPPGLPPAQQYYGYPVPGASTMAPEYVDQVWGMEPGTEELEAPMKSGVGGTLAFLSGTNTCRCGVCGQNVIWKDAAARFIKCPRCKVLTPRKGAKPLAANMQFVHCGGQCRALLMVPEGCSQYVCPRERVLCVPLHR